MNAGMDICVVLYRCDATRVEAGVRDRDRLIVVDNTHENRGFARGCNLAAAQGSQPLVCFLNPDGDLIGDCLDRLERTFDDPSVVAVGPNLGERMNQQLLEDGSPAFLSGCCLVVRRSAFEAVGGFDERFFMYGEDVDLYWKLRKQGKAVRVEDAHFRHDWSSTRRRFSSMHRAFRHHLVVMKRHHGKAEVEQMIRDGIYNARSGEVKRGLARLSGSLDYLTRARRWV